jgi:filamentous hemagglutinin family protein
MACRWYLMSLLAVQAFSLPQGSRCSEGVTAGINANQIHVEAKATRTAIDWESFSIAADEKVFFDLPSNDAAILNQVTGGSESQILGQMQSNQGSIYLINPNGIIIGQDAVINVGAVKMAAILFVRVTGASLLMERCKLSRSISLPKRLNSVLELR